MDRRLYGTKERIFDCSLQLFADQGYDKISVNDIAQAVGIRSASIYNHFKSKQQILDLIYDYFCEHYHESILSEEEYDPIIQWGTGEEIAKLFQHVYLPCERMYSMVRIVSTRVHIDPRANEIYHKIMDDGLSFATKVLEKCVEYGRLSKHIKIKTFAVLSLNFQMLSVNFAMLPEGKEPSYWKAIESELFEELCSYFRKPRVVHCYVEN